MVSLMPGSKGQQRTPALRPRNTKLAQRGEAEVGAGGAGFQLAGQCGVGGGDGDVKDQRVVRGDLLEKVDVSGDERGLGDDADAEALLAGEDFEEATGNADAAFDGLVGIGGGADGDLFGWVDGAKLLLEEPGGVFLEVDLVFEG